MTEQEFEANLKAEGFETFTTVTQEPGHAMGDHAHAFEACALITAGRITLDVSGAVSTYHRGDIFRLAAGTSHTENAGLEGVSYRVGRKGAAS